MPFQVCPPASASPTSARPARIRSRAARRFGATIAALLVSALATTQMGASCNSVVSVEVRDAATGQKIPAKITVFSSVGEPKNLGTNTGGALVSWFQNKVFMGAGSGSLDLPAGIYDIWASRGVEWTVDHQTLDTSAPHALVFNLSRAVDTSGFLAADFHIHARPSFESALQSPKLPELPDRVLQYMTEGIEILGSADHDCVIDYSPVIQSLGLAALVTSLVGAEATPGLDASPDGNGNCDQIGPGYPPGSAETGHWNAFPIAANSIYTTTADTGVNVTAAAIYDYLHTLGDSNTLIQLNHPYFKTSAANIGWMDKRGFDPNVPIPATWPGSDTPTNAFMRHPSVVPGSATQGLDFDVLEMWAGGAVAQGRSTRAAWFSLLDQGFLKVATANGDAHNAQRSAGYPRSMVYLGTDNPTAVTPNQIASAVRAGRVIGTTGPIPNLTVNGTGMGGLVPDTDGTVDVAINVQAAPWIPVQEVRVIVNGSVAQTIALSAQAPEPSVRYANTLPITITKDSWILVEAGDPLPADPNAEPPVPYEYSRVTAGAPFSAGSTAGFTPLSFTNPVFVDFDGNGHFDAPGL